MAVLCFHSSPRSRTASRLLIVEHTWQSKHTIMDTRRQIRHFIAENFLLSGDGFSLGDDASLLESGVIDSTGVLELIGFVEDTFQVEVRDEEIVPENFDSVDRIAAYISDKTGASILAGEQAC